MTDQKPSWHDLIVASLENSGNPNVRAIADLLFPQSMNISPPPLIPLSHYTTFEGLQGILSKGHLWATEVLYLNDSTERDYARGLLEKHLVEQEALNPSPVLREALKAARDVLDGSRERYAHFALCFCEKPDLLGMWTSYASRGGGFSLEFNGPEISELAARPLGSFVKVAYGDELSRHPMMRGFANSCARIAETDPATVNPQVIGATLAISLDNLFVRVKHPAFRQEEEWRVLVRVNMNPEVNSCSQFQFRGADSVIKPYLELGLSPRGHAGPRLLPLRRVTVGPTLRPADTVRAVRWLLRKHRYPESIAVIPSEVPFRL